VPDPSQTGMYLALIQPGSYFEFSKNVLFKVDGTLMERGLYNDAGNISGRAQAAVRPISKSDFNRILDAGLSDLDTPLPRIDQADSTALHVEEGKLHLNMKLAGSDKFDRAVRPFAPPSSESLC